MNLKKQDGNVFLSSENARLLPPTEPKPSYPADSEENSETWMDIFKGMASGTDPMTVSPAAVDALYDEPVQVPIAVPIKAWANLNSLTIYILLSDGTQLRANLRGYGDKQITMNCSSKLIACWHAHTETLQALGCELIDNGGYPEIVFAGETVRPNLLEGYDEKEKE